MYVIQTEILSLYEVNVLGWNDASFDLKIALSISDDFDSVLDGFEDFVTIF